MNYLDPMRFPVREWQLSEKAFNSEDLARTETLFSVANGYIGLRGNYEEGRASYLHGSFINGLHETWRIQHAEEAFGLAQVGQSIVNVPDAKPIRLYVDDEPLILDEDDLEYYDRTLDFQEGVLSRSIIWRTASGKRVRVDSKRMVSFTERHLALMTFEVELLDGDAEVVISCQIQNRQDGQGEYGSTTKAMGLGFDPRKAQEFEGRVFEPRDFWQKDNRTAMSYQIANSKMTLGIVADHHITTENELSTTQQIDMDFAKHVYRVRAKQGVPIMVSKAVSYHSSRGVRAREMVDRCLRTLDRVEHEGIEHQFIEQREWLDEFWERSDVIVLGEPELQQAIRWNLFQLAQASIRAETWGIPAKGLTGSGYSGHYFWDTEIYSLPFLSYTTPLVARNALRFRYNMLPAARRRALEVNEVGALFPWRTIDGHEASAFFAAGTAQYHIDADISYAIAKYVRATGDEDFLKREAIDVVVETARMWMGLGFWRRDGDGKFHIYGVTGPDEYTTVVNDNLYTNVMARFNLDYARQSVQNIMLSDPDAYTQIVDRLKLGTDELLRWDEAARAMEIPYIEHLGIHPQDDQFLDREVWDLAHTPESKRPLLLHYHPLTIYRFQVLKQADVVLALYLQGDHFTAAQKRADFAYYDPITTGDSSLSAVVQSIIAAEVGFADLALKYFYDAVYVDLADLHNNSADGVHIASTGGVWSMLVGGFAGMRDYHGKISFDPRLPEKWGGINFKLTVTGTRAHFELKAKSLKVTVEDSAEGKPFSFTVRDVD
ncbi:MAG: glycosyl hydrolase family 65 protein, partial [Microbacteriaceae bacterium]